MQGERRSIWGLLLVAEAQLDVIGNNCLVEFKVEKLGGDGKVESEVGGQEGRRELQRRAGFRSTPAQPSQARSSGRSKSQAA